MTHYRLFFDGSCGPKNPGGTAAYGYALLKDGEESPICFGHSIIGTGPEMSNNLAEFTALNVGLLRFSYLTMLKRVQERGDLHVFGDSKLVINVMNRWWTPKPETRYYSAYQAALHNLTALRREHVRVSFDWVPRAQNTYCDTLSKEHTKKCDKLAQTP